MLNHKQDTNKVEKKNWYNDRYEFVSIQRNVFALITLLSLTLSLIATFSISQLVPLKSVEPFVIQVDEKTGATQVVDPLKAHELTANEAVNQYFIVQYCRARESFLGGTMERNYYNYNTVRVLSEPDLFRQYQTEIAPSNPDSPSTRLGMYGSREIHISSIKFLDKKRTTTGEDAIRYLIKAQITEKMQGGGGQTVRAKTMQKLILLEFKYVELELSVEDRYLNPLGFQVTSYSVNEDNLTQ